MEVTESQIIEQLKAGNEEAYRYLYRHHYRVLCRFALEYVHDAYQAESIVEDLIFHLWDIRETLQVDTSLRSFLVQAVRNRCLNYLASGQQRHETPFSELGLSEDEDLHNLPHSHTPLGTLLEMELEEEIAAAIRNLPDTCRDIFIRSRFEGQKHEEIARQLGITVATVKYHIRKAMDILSKALSHFLVVILLFLA